MAAATLQDVAVWAVIAAAAVYLIVSAVQAIRHRRAGCCDKPACQDAPNASTNPPTTKTHFIPVENLAKTARQKTA